MSNTKITVLGTEVTVISDVRDNNDFISLTDMAGGRKDDSRAADVIKNWIRTRGTIEFLGTWEILHNPDFNVVEFDHFKMQAGLPSFVLSASEWIEKTYASINQLICLSNMENLNAVLIHEGVSQKERLEKLNKIAIQQMEVLEKVESCNVLTESTK